MTNRVCDLSLTKHPCPDTDHRVCIILDQTGALPCKIFDMNPPWHLPVSQGLMDRLSGPILKDLHIQRGAKISTGVLLSFSSNRYGRQRGKRSMSKRNVLMDKDDVVWPELLIIYRLMKLSVFKSTSFLGWIIASLNYTFLFCLSICLLLI